ncbi:MAG: RHS repeat-associated core domain-containing protein [Myxococcota bacterium]
MFKLGLVTSLYFGMAVELPGLVVGLGSPSNSIRTPECEVSDWVGPVTDGECNNCLCRLHMPEACRGAPNCEQANTRSFVEVGSNSCSGFPCWLGSNCDTQEILDELAQIDTCWEVVEEDTGYEVVCYTNFRTEPCTEVTTGEPSWCNDKDGDLAPDCANFPAHSTLDVNYAIREDCEPATVCPDECGGDVLSCPEEEAESDEDERKEKQSCGDKLSGGGVGAGSQHGDPIDVTSGEVLVPPNGPDITAGRGELIEIERGYSSKRALIDSMALYGEYSASPVRTAIMDLPPSILGPGWYHSLDFWIVRDVTSSDATVSDILVTPGRDVVRLVPGGESGNGHWTVESSGATFLSVRAPSGSLYRFEEFDGPILRLVEIDRVDREPWTLTYYSSSGSDAQCRTAEAWMIGAICAVENASGDRIDFGEYTEGAWGQPLLGRLASSDYEVSYSYQLEESYSAGRFYFHLDVGTEYLDSVRWSNGRRHREFLEYTRDAYYRPDLASETSSFQFDTYITTPGNRSYSLLEKHKLSSIDTAVIAAYAYDAWGRGVVSYAPGEALRFDYIDPVAGEAERRVMVANESSGEVYEVLINADGQVTDISDGCACSTQPAQFERLDDGTLLAEVSVPPGAGVDEPARGIRTTYLYDDRGRAVLVKRNAGASEDVSSLPSDPTLAPTDVRRFSYLEDGRLSERSRVFSAPCLDGTSLHPALQCPVDSLDEEPRIVFDYDEGANAYDAAINTSPGKRVTQIVRRGITLIDIETGELGWTSQTVATQYDQTGNILQVDEPLGVSTRYRYHDLVTGGDQAGRVREVEIGGTLVASYQEYDDINPTIVVDEENGVTTNFRYNAGRVSRWEIPPDRVNTSFVYDSYGVVQDVSRPIKVRSIAENSLDRGCFPYSGDASSVADGIQDCLRSVGELGHVVDGRIEGGGRFAIERDAQGNPLQSTLSDSSGSVQRAQSAEFDEQGRITRRTYFSDAATDPWSVRGVHEYYRNAMGWAYAETTPDFADPTRPHADNETAANVFREFDRLGRVTSQTVGAGTSVESTTRFTYDVHGNLSSSTDSEGRLFQYVHDDYGRLILVDSPDSRITLYQYNDGGRLAKERAADGTITEYEYDERGRLATVRYNVATGPHLADELYSYDNFDDSLATVGAVCGPTGRVFDPEHVGGRLAWVKHEAGVTFYSYTSWGEVKAVYQQRGDAFDVCNLEITRYDYEYQQRVGVTYPSGLSIRYGLTDGSLQLLSLHRSDVGPGEDGAILDYGSIGMSVTGAIESYRAGDLSFATDWDLSGRFIRRDYSSSLASFHWTADVDNNGVVDDTERDRSGRELRLADLGTSAAGSKTTTLSYDARGRLVSAHGENLRGYQECAWTHDTAGNRLSETCYGNTITYAAGDGASQLVSTSFETNGASCGDPVTNIEQNRSVDERGRQTNGYRARFGGDVADYTLAYGPTGRLSRAAVGASTYDYAYDHRGLRLRTTAYGGTTGFRDAVYDLNGSLLSETGFDGSTTEYIWYRRTPVAALYDPDGAGPDEGELVMLGVDHLGTPQRAWNRVDGSQAWACDLTPFGECHPWGPGGSAPRVAINLRAPGQVEDAETGLHYNWHRYYNPATGRYLSEDPLLRTIPGFGESAYSYARGNPIRYTDPDGRCPICVAIGVIVAEAIADVLVVGGTAAGVVAGTQIIDHYMNEDSSGENECAPKAGAPVAGDESLGQQIAAGHAGEKHLDDLGAEDADDLAALVDGIVQNPSDVKDLSDGRRGYWSDEGIVVIENPNDPDGGTVFRPDRGRDFFDDL